MLFIVGIYLPVSSSLKYYTSSMAVSTMVICSYLILTLCCVSAFSFYQYNLCLNASEHEGEFELPSTTMNYKDEVCQTIIENQENASVQLSLVGVTTCRLNNNNYVKIYGNMVLKGVYCLNAEANEEHIAIQSRVITIVYKASLLNKVKTVKRNPVVIKYTKTIRRSCQHVFKTNNGTFHNPDFPGYTRNLDCEWQINADQGRNIVLKFIKLKSRVGGSRDCLNNYVEVRDRKENKAAILAKFCVNYWHPITILSNTSNLLVTIKSMSGVSFIVTYTTTISCIHSPGIQTFYRPPNGYCKEWDFAALEPRKIGVLSFSGMNLKSTDPYTCSGNLLEVWDGENTNIYCNNNYPPKIISSKGGALKVTYRSEKYHGTSNNFVGSFTSVLPENYNNKCFVQNGDLHFRCGDQKTIPCSFLCDGAIQCRDNSDESSCPEMKARWKKIQVFVIIMGSVCASTVVFCVGLICFRKYVLRNVELTDSHGRQYSSSEQTPLTPQTDLPSPPPSYFNGNQSIPPSIIRGTYFFGNEFSQSGIHSAFLFGIPPPRYRSTESVRQPQEENHQWSDIPLVPTVSTGDPPAYQRIETDVKEDQKSTGAEVANELTLCEPSIDIPHEPTDISTRNTVDNSNTIANNLACTLMHV